MHTTVQFDKFTEFWILTIYTVVLIFFSSNQIMLLLLFLWNMWWTTCQHQKYWKCCLANFAVKHQISCRQKRRHYHHPCHCHQLHCLQYVSCSLFRQWSPQMHASLQGSLVFPQEHRCVWHWPSHPQDTNSITASGAGGWSVQSIVSVPSLMIQPAKHH